MVSEGVKLGKKPLGGSAKHPGVCGKEIMGKFGVNP
jgi:hypothetical protein